MFNPFVITVIVIARWCLLLHSLLFSKACGEATRHLDEFIGSPTAELYECELSIELRSVECRVERSVGLAIDVDVSCPSCFGKRQSRVQGACSVFVSVYLPSNLFLLHNPSLFT